MDTRNQKLSSQLVRILMVSIAIYSLSILHSQATNLTTQTIETNGWWPKSKGFERSLHICPITAYLNDNYIQITNNKPDCDITVSILSINTGEIIIQQTVPESATSNIIIPVVNLSSGEYVLELTDSGTRYLRGTFRK